MILLLNLPCVLASRRHLGRYLYFPINHHKTISCNQYLEFLQLVCNCAPYTISVMFYQNIFIGEG